MLLTREETRFQFQGKTFDLNHEKERELLGWVFDQFLYGEVTGIQCGHWLYRAPSLHAAMFLAEQAKEELSHVKRILRIQSLLGQVPRPAHGAIRFLATGMMGGSWGQHVAMEMALGEGLVLVIFEAMHDTIPDEKIQKILASALEDERKHVNFGEKETLEWLEHYPQDRSLLLASAWFQLGALRRLKRFVEKRVLRRFEGHPVLNQFGDFFDFAVKSHEIRMERLGLTHKPLSQWSLLEKITLLVKLPLARIRVALRRRPLLTSTYLNDPVVKLEAKRSV